MEPGKTIKVTKINVEEIKASIISLIKNKDKLVFEMQDYPLQIDFAGYRITLSNNIDLETLIQSLQGKIRSYYKNE